LQLPIWFWHYYIPQLTPIKLWIAEERELERALSLLEEMDELLRQVNRKTHRIDILALQALAYRALDNWPKALEKLSQSVALAAPGKFIRNYLDLGPKMRELLTHLQKQGETFDEPYIAQILDAYPVATSPDEKRISPVSISPLTTRELEVLKYLAMDLSTKDIAREMNVTWATTRTHIKHVYAKLGVHGRYEAVQCAKELALL
jgi:LuxR family maltose regulon positive regulatory protein